MDADDEDKAEALQEEGERLGEQLQALEDGLLDYAASVKAAAGAIVTIDRNGEAVIHRGLLREAEAKALRTLEKLRQGFSGADRKSTRLNSSHLVISYAVFCLKKKKNTPHTLRHIRLHTIHHYDVSIYLYLTLHSSHILQICLALTLHRVHWI